MKQDNRAYAKQLMVHYFRVAITRAGGYWHSDNAVECELLVDAIIDAAMDEVSKRFVDILKAAKAEGKEG